MDDKINTEYVLRLMNELTTERNKLQNNLKELTNDKTKFKKLKLYESMIGDCIKLHIILNYEKTRFD